MHRLLQHHSMTDGATPWPGAAVYLADRTSVRPRPCSAEPRLELRPSSSKARSGQVARVHRGHRLAQRPMCSSSVPTGSRRLRQPRRADQRSAEVATAECRQLVEGNREGWPRAEVARGAQTVQSTAAWHDRLQQPVWAGRLRQARAATRTRTRIPHGSGPTRTQTRMPPSPGPPLTTSGNTVAAAEAVPGPISGRTGTSRGGAQELRNATKPPYRSPVASIHVKCEICEGAVIDAHLMRHQMRRADGSRCCICAECAAVDMPAPTRQPRLIDAAATLGEELSGGAAAQTLRIKSLCREYRPSDSFSCRANQL